MLDSVVSIFDNMKQMQGKLRKKTYEGLMNEFREKQGHYFDEMLEYVSTAQIKENAADEIADCFCSQVGDEFKGRFGRIAGRKQIDLNLFMIVYVFPAIKLTKHEDSELVCHAICKKWNKSFKTDISYSDYDAIYAGFNDKIFGFF